MEGETAAVPPRTSPPEQRSELGAERAPPAVHAGLVRHRCRQGSPCLSSFPFPNATTHMSSLSLFRARGSSANSRNPCAATRCEVTTADIASLMNSWSPLFETDSTTSSVRPRLPTAEARERLLAPCSVSYAFRFANSSGGARATVPLCTNAAFRASNSDSVTFSKSCRTFLPPGNAIVLVKRESKFCGACDSTQGRTDFRVIGGMLPASVMMMPPSRITGSSTTVADSRLSLLEPDAGPPCFFPAASNVSNARRCSASRSRLFSPTPSAGTRAASKCVRPTSFK
mmetsp:Transcript_110170/g.295677  ORF Transcript_110170/g.295677 Transcript_110170/m.295677 type:complete len:285 (+) Transcript_110170:108-962(+)